MQGKVAIVTGASSGIGRATASLFAANGMSVLAVGRDEAALKNLSDGASSAEGSIRVLLADVTDSDQIDHIVSNAIQSFGQIDVLVNSAGILTAGNIENTSADDWDALMDINLRSVFLLMQRSFPYLEITKGNVVNVSSVAGTRAFPGVLGY